MNKIHNFIELFFFVHRNLQIPNDQSTPEIITTNNDYCRIDTKTLKRKPFHRAGFFFYKRGSFRSTKQVYEIKMFFFLKSLIYLSFRIIND